MGYQNKLAQEKSPYLLQHRHNPVDWYPWGEDAFRRAREEDKPIFLSIGYSTCHWCHVMEAESFEDEEVAELLNDTFVCIKVDREERPDVDDIYMTVCQMMTGAGGWPLTVLMTPDRKPFWAGTYLPKQSRNNQMGLMDLVPRVRMNWEQARNRVEERAAELTDTLRRAAAQSTAGATPGEDEMDEAFLRLWTEHDSEHGGFNGAPKFPTPHHQWFLLRFWNRTGREKALSIVERTLVRMRRGGIFDHVGFGFHRYATDEKWRLPHFEKMLYDQAGLLLAYAEAHQATGRESFARTARQTATYVLRDLSSDRGGFHSAEDADTEGVEGKFYLFTTDEVRSMLPDEDADLVIRVFDLREEGNYVDEATRRRTGANVLVRSRSVKNWALSMGTQPDELAEYLEGIRQRLFEYREQRVRPGLDDKILTDWNGYMIAALAVAARVLDERDYTDAARRAADFVLTTLRRDDGRLWHRYRDGDAGIDGHLDDYAFMVWGLVELYQTTLEVRWLRAARELAVAMIEHFWDGDNGALFMTADDGEELLVRQKRLHDGAMPSGNAIAMIGLLRLARLTGSTGLEKYADRIAAAAAKQIAQHPTGFTAMLAGVDFAVGPSREIVIAGDASSADTQAMLAAVRSRYLPRTVVLHRPPGAEPEIASVAPFTASQTPIDGAATAYVCEHFQCHEPVTDVEVLIRQLEE